jgi:hypothetical protein
MWVLHLQEITPPANFLPTKRHDLTDDGRPPLEAAGLRLHDRLEAIEASLGRIEEKGDICQRS